MLTADEGRECLEQLDAVHALAVEIERHQNPGHQTPQAGVRVREHSQCHFMLRLLQDRVQEGRLAGPRLAGDDREDGPVE